MTRAPIAALVLGLSLLVLASAAAPAFAQPAAPTTPTAFYLEYRKAFDAAKKIEDLLPYMSAATRKQVEATPAADRPQMFEMVKMLGTLTNVKVVKETPAGDGATLTVTGTDADKATMTGTISIVKEGGAFKLGKESWTNK